jgi:YD repeat-containing protein
MKSSAKKRGHFAFIDNRVTSRTTMNASKTLLCALLARVLLLWSPETHASTITYTYDPAGRIVAADYGAGKSTSYAYDNAGNLLQSSQPSPGLIVGPIVNGQFSIAWPSAPGGFVLESTPSLGGVAIWSPVGVVPTQVVNRNVVTLSVTPTNKFFRLHK